MHMLNWFNTVLLLLSHCMLIAQSSNITDPKGRKQGLWEKRDEKGYLIYKGEFKDDKPLGMMRHYYKGTDSIKAILKYRKDGSVDAKLFNENNYKLNAEGKFISEKKDSIWRFYDDLGKLISIEYYKKGLKHGKSQVFFPNGKLSEESTYIDDKKHGLVKRLYDSGQIKSEQNYKMGVLEGVSIVYFPNKEEAARGYYKNGDKNHIWVYKKQDGTVESKEYWWEGIELKEDAYIKIKQSTKNNPEETTKEKTETKVKTNKKINKP
jgi:antitoxin component YwqK of YwqJK toxin-antitoxin module